MTITRIGDAKEDEAAWLEARKTLLTSSEMYTWLGNTESWWSDTREDVLAGKHGEEKVFDAETETTIAHGVYDEEHVIGKFGYAAGCQVLPDNGLFVNDRFPGIGASIDGLGKPDPDAEPHPVLSQDRTLFPFLHQLINDEGQEFLLECKKSLSVKWPKECPGYYIPQVKTQLAVLELDFAIIFAETVHTRATQKWRKFWDLRAHVIRRDPSWDRVLEREGQKFLTLLEG
jgi:hypothetical protein